MTQRAKAETKPLSSLEGDILDHGQITDEDRLYERTIRTIHVLCTSQFPLRSLPTLLSLQFENGLEVSFDHISVGTPGEGGLTDWLQAGANIFLRDERDKASSTVMSVLFPQGVPFGAMGDGSNDRSQREQEAIVHRFLGPDGRPYNTFADLAELDLTKSVDGHSPDAQCITACYSNSFSRYNLHEGFVHMSDWAKALVAGSFDGASVMLGSQNGVVAKLAVEAPQTIWIHAAAHVTQLALGEAVGHLEYYVNWRATVQEVYVYYRLSGKKAFGLSEVASVLDVGLLVLKGSHGIRWAAADERAVRALLQDLPAIVVDLEVTAKRELGINFSTLTPSESFLNKKFDQKFDGKKWKATVLSFEKKDNAAADVFTLGYRDGKRLTMPKAELVSHFTKETDQLLEDSRWVLRSKLLQFRFAHFTSFMLDFYAVAAKLSCSLQGNMVNVFDMVKSVNKASAALATLKGKAAENEVAFLAECSKDLDADVYKSACHLEEGEQGRELVKVDRLLMCDALSGHLETRFTKVLDTPEINAFAVFDHRKWPALVPKEPIEVFGKPEISLLFDHYSGFFGDTSKDEVLREWLELKREILQAQGLISRKFTDLWPHMIVQFGDDYPHVLRLAAFVLLLPVDTSECERIFSLMNNIKSNDRSRLSQANLRNLMLWHYHGKKFTLQNFPWLSILKEFKLLTPNRKRQKHTAFTRAGPSSANAPVVVSVGPA